MTTIHNAEFLAWAKSYSGPKFHAALCDPPYGISFMGKEWDQQKDSNAYQIQAYYWAKALHSLLYPGAIVMMFGGTRMWHRLAAGMEDAGFHVWDTLMWLYGQGFPKGQQLRIPGWEGHRTPALKPAWEPILCFRAPDDGRTYADLALSYGSAALNVDAGRIELTGENDPRLGGKGDWGTKNAAKNVYSGGYAGDRVGSSPLGRYPANLALDEEAAAMLDAHTGTLASGEPVGQRQQDGGYGGKYGLIPVTGFGDSGGASRFFYCAKATRAEREAGLERIDTVPFGMSNQAKAEIARGTESFENSDMGVNSVRRVKNPHPTVKPIDLNRWLASMLLPPEIARPRRLLVPFCGVASEIIGASQAGWDEIVGVETDATYCAIGQERLLYFCGGLFHEANQNPSAA